MPARHESHECEYLDGVCRHLTCSRCHNVTNNATQGHYWRWCDVTMSPREFHYCCPGDCELTTVKTGEEPTKRISYREWRQKMAEINRAEDELKNAIEATTLTLTDRRKLVADSSARLLRLEDEMPSWATPEFKTTYKTVLDSMWGCLDGLVKEEGLV